jgi:hypothetical protein
MRFKRITTMLVLLAAFSTKAICQKIVLLEAEPIVGWGNGVMGSSGYGVDIRGHYETFGLKVGYANSYANETDVKNYYKYFNIVKAAASWRFAHKNSSINEDNQKEIAHLVNIGYTSINAYKHRVFEAVDTTLRPPDNNPSETRRLLDVYSTDMKFHSGFISIGYERLKRVYFKGGGGKVTRGIYNALGSFNGYIETTADPGVMSYISSVYFDFLLLPQQGLQYSPRFTSDLKNSASGSVPIMETMFINKLGFRMGYEISMIGLVVFNFGIETGIMPGIFQYSSVYGNGFPEDNLYFGGKAGFSLGRAAHLKKKRKI